MTIRRTLLATVAAAALIVPTAQAQAPDVNASTAGGGAAQAQPPDMHASTAEAAAAQAQPPDMHASTAEAAAAQRLREAGQVPPAGQGPASDGDGSPAPLILLVAGAIVALSAALTARHVRHRASHRTRIAA